MIVSLNVLAKLQREVDLRIALASKHDNVGAHPL